MAFEQLKFTKSWESAEDFPTFELDEKQVRADLQLLHDETKQFINEKLVAPLNEKGGAGNILTSSGESVEEVLTTMQEQIKELSNSSGGEYVGGGLYVFDDGEGNVTLGGVQEG